MRVAGPERRRLSWDGPGVNVPLATGPAAQPQERQVRDVAMTKQKKEQRAMSEAVLTFADLQNRSIGLTRA